MTFQMDEVTSRGARIRVVGIGGAGCNAINRMVDMNLSGIDFIACNTDIQALTCCRATNRFQLGVNLTRGLGTGGNPKIGCEAVLEDEETIRKYLEGSDMIFITAGMGGGTGTGGAPIIAQIARDLGILTIAVVTKPFQFEGKRKLELAENGIRDLQDYADTLIVVPNQRLLHAVETNTTLKDAFRLADDVLCNAVQGISELITLPGLINLDFADVRSVMSSMGKALLGSGVGKGETRAADAVQRAIRSPLLEDLSIQGARTILINITGGEDLTLTETTSAVEMIQHEADKDANITIGAVIHEAFRGMMKITVIATGYDTTRIKEIPLSRVSDSTRSLQVLNGGVTDSAMNYESYELPLAASGRSQGVQESKLDSRRVSSLSGSNQAGVDSRSWSANSNDRFHDHALTEDPALDSNSIAAHSRSQSSPLLFSGHPIQPELEYPEISDIDRSKLPPYSHRNLASGSFQRKPSIDSDSFPVDTSNYMIPAFLRRKAD